MQQEEIRKYQLTQIELMEEVDRICSKLNLTYYIIGGTLLGAIRHGGFIPWDPDIDIAMPRNDYEKMREYWSNNPSEKYFYQHYSTEKNHLSPHALLRLKGTHIVYKSHVTKYTPEYDGIYLDIFPLDKAPSTRKEQEAQMLKIKKIKRKIELKAGYVYAGETNFVKKVLKKALQIVLLPWSFRRLNKKMDETMRKYNGGESEYLVSMASHYSYWKQLIPKDVYGEPKRVKFENLELLAPCDTNEYLTRLYKDYMKLPPEEQRYFDIGIIGEIDYGNYK